MKDNFDKILAKKIKDLIQNEVHSYNPEHWDMLKVKKKQSKKRVLFYWRFAGVFLLFLIAGGIGRMLLNDNNIEKDNKLEIIHDNINDSLRIDSLKNDNKIFITTIDIDSLTNVESEIAYLDSISIKDKLKSSSKKKFNINNKTSTSQIAFKGKNIKEEKLFISSDSISDDLLDGKDNLVEINSTLKNENIINNKALTTLNDDIKNHEKNILALNEEENLKIENNNKNIRLGIGLSPIFNSNGISEKSTIGFSGGVTIEVPISKRFDINLGAFYANQKINLYQPNSNVYDGVSSRSSSQLISKEAIIKGIEIPLNIKYNFSIDKMNLFVSAGFSSTSYIEESIEANYLAYDRTETKTLDLEGNNIVRYDLVQVDRKVSTPNSSNNFNFANILNLSFGIKFPVNKQRQLIILEPYFKYSLAPVTQQKLDLSSAGIHLHYNFSLKR